MNTQETPFIIVDGISYRLWKRGTRDDSPWWFRVQQKGKRISLSTHTTDVEQAKSKAFHVIQAARKGSWTEIDDMRVDAPKPPRHVPTFARLFAVAKLMEIESMPLYITSMTRLVEEGLGTKGILKLHVDVLTLPLVRAFQAKRQGLPKAKLDRPTPANSSANAVLSNAKCLFSKKALSHYQLQGLQLPDLSAFIEADALIEERSRYSDEIISNALLAEIDKSVREASQQVREALDKVRLHGVLPGDLSGNDRAALGRFLRKHGLTPTDIHLHAGACMYARTGSIEAAARFCGIKKATAEWHWGQMKVALKPLSIAETYL